MEHYIYQLTLEVRDYECDLQGIVNNANYMHYLEHSRHEFLKSFGTSFSELHKRGIDTMVSRAEIDYKSSLTSNDRFVVKIALKREGAKLIFLQDIFRLPDEKICIKGRIETICVENGRLTKGEIFDHLFYTLLT